jgi:hypothetical protein
MDATRHLCSRTRWTISSFGAGAVFHFNDANQTLYFSADGTQASVIAVASSGRRDPQRARFADRLRRIVTFLLVGGMPIPLTSAGRPRPNHLGCTSDSAATSGTDIVFDTRRR